MVNSVRAVFGRGCSFLWNPEILCDFYGVPIGTKTHAKSSNHFFNYTVMLFIYRRSYM